MITQIHILLTYGCTSACDHCFLYCSPGAPGAFTHDNLERLFDQIAKDKNIDWVYFEGGEPFLHYDLMVEGLRRARQMGLQAGIVTNGYWATSAAAAEDLLRPLADMGVADFTVSDDTFHQANGNGAPAKTAMDTAEKLGLPVNTIRVADPAAGVADTGSAVRFRGRAADTLTENLAWQPLESFDECPHEPLGDPRRVHLDAYGHVQICQGISIGNIWKTPLAEILANYDATSHPICGPLVEGGPARLAQAFGVDCTGGYVSACHLCFETRRALTARFPGSLAPPQVYSLG